jgi:hypothetical protein
VGYSGTKVSTVRTIDTLLSVRERNFVVLEPLRITFLVECKFSIKNKGLVDITLNSPDAVRGSTLWDGESRTL